MSIVRENLLTVPGYRPYCGNPALPIGHLVRMNFDGKQFVCGCGWRTNFEAEFIAAYVAFAGRALPASGVRGG